MEKPSLYIFDFDETLSIDASCHPIEKLASEPDKLKLKEINDRYEHEHRCWNRRMTEVHQKLAEQGISSQQMIEAMRTIELSPGTEQLFREIHAHNDKIVIISNACDLVVSECLRAQHLLNYVDRIESNPVRQIEPIIVIDEYTDPTKNQCQICDPNLCKGSLIDQYRNRNCYEKMIFVGDGDNDVCAAMHLDSTDIVFAKIDKTSKKNYKMYDLLKNRYFQQLKTDLLTWTTMNDVYEFLKTNNIL